MYVCLKHVHVHIFSLKLSYEFRLQQYTNFERITWRAWETLVKQPLITMEISFATLGGLRKWVFVVCYSLCWNDINRAMVNVMSYYGTTSIMRRRFLISDTNHTVELSPWTRYPPIHSRKKTLQWRHTERDDVSNQRRLDCKLNPLSRRRSKKRSNLRVTCLCEGIGGEYPGKRASNAENVPFDDVTMRQVLCETHDTAVRTEKSLIEYHMSISHALHIFQGTSLSQTNLLISKLQYMYIYLL